MKKLLFVLVLALGVLHQDFWNWDNGNLVFGFMPVALAYHAGYTLAAVLLWCFAVKFAWPSELEAWAESAENEDKGGDS